MQKIFISAQQLLQDSFRLAARVFESGFRPHFIVGIWRGGAPVGIAVQEYFELRAVDSDHIAVRTSSYPGIDRQLPQIRVHGLHYLLEQMRCDHSLLIVDDVFDSGRSVAALLEALRSQAGEHYAKDVRIACPWYKPSHNKVGFAPDYYLHETDRWLVFPHEVAGLSAAEIAEGKKDLAEILELFVPPAGD